MSRICRQNWNLEILHIQSEKALWWNIFENQNQSVQKFSFWREPAKSEMLPHAIYSHWSKTFELYHFQSPREVACVASVPNRVIARTLEREQWKGEGEGRRGNACPQTQDSGKRPLIFHERLLRNVNGIKNLLPKLNPHKAPSPDNLHTQVLKQ